MESTSLCSAGWKGSQRILKDSEKLPNNVSNEDACGNRDHDKQRMTATQLQAQDYLEKKKIIRLFNFLIGHLLVDEPLDPIEYLSELLDKCILFRSGLREPPLLFTTRHIRSMYQSLDPAGTGSISFDQFKTGMTTLGICCYDTCPIGSNLGRISQQTFETEAKKCLEKMLEEMVGKKTKE